MSSATAFPEYVNGEPPTFTLQEYDNAAWIDRTSLDHDHLTNRYKVVQTDDPTKVIALIHNKDSKTLDEIFKSAKLSYASQNGIQK